MTTNLERAQEILTRIRGASGRDEAELAIEISALGCVLEQMTDEERAAYVAWAHEQSRYLVAQSQAELERIRKHADKMHEIQACMDLHGTISQQLADWLRFDADMNPDPMLRAISQAILTQLGLSGNCSK